MQPIDLEYYRRRLAAEQAAAERARHPLAADCHRRLAEQYATLLGAHPTAAAAAE